MQYPELKDYFAEQVYPTQPNEWEFEDVLHDIERLTEDQQLTLLQVVPAVWPISQILCHSVLKEGVQHADRITRQNLAEWLRQILFHYEKGGLLNARTFMANADLHSVNQLPEVQAIALKDQLPRLTAYAAGLSGDDLTLRASTEIYTDTETIYLPHEISIFADAESNLLFYKFIIAVQCGFICLGSLGKQLLIYQSNHQDNALKSTGDTFLSSFANQPLAQDIYQLAEFSRVALLLKNEYPGLTRQATPLITKLLSNRAANQTAAGRLIEGWFSSALVADSAEPADAAHSRILVEQLYNQIETVDEEYESFSFLPFMSRFNLEESQTVFNNRVTRNKKKFETLFALFLSTHKMTTSEKPETEGTPEAIDSARLQLSNTSSNEKKKETSDQIVIDNKRAKLPDDILDLVKQIENDLGSLPQSYVSAAFGISGGGINKAEGERHIPRTASSEFLPYDEWDYRRQGYRKNWCSLRERELTGVQSDFIPQTLKKYHGQLQRIKRQFELMYTQERFARRRRSGDDIDLDALIDSLGDQCAGLPPSENLFIQLIRDQRSISTLFLVDMSNSTEGWVGHTIKEALVLLCEAMEMVGDAYGIYGFSGMRRMRSEVYRIKEISDRYDTSVKERLAAIGPKEYTRMGPPIRHMIKQFAEIDTRVRLLVILSDGKPEDYDDYKHQYAIEDTRKALAEAKGQGIHTYCITIDKEAHDYLEHLFGSGNYTFVPTVELLPSRLTEIYRLLTQ